MQRATLLALRRAPLTAATASSSIIAPMRPAVAVCARTGGLPMRAAPRRQVIAMMPTMQLQRSFASTASSGNSSAPKPAEAANSGSSSSSAGAGSDGSSGSSGGQQQSNSSGSSSSSSGGGGYFRSDSWTKTVGTIGAIANWTIPLAGITHMINAKDPATTIDPVMTSGQGGEATQAQGGGEQRRSHEGCVTVC